jgi:hypothetical protein
LEETRRVVEALMKVGPRFSDISRATGIPVSTIRYIILKRLPKLGLSVGINKLRSIRPTKIS